MRKLLLMLSLLLTTCLCMSAATEITEDFATNTSSWLPTSASTTSATKTSPTTGISYTFTNAYWYKSGKALFIKYQDSKQSSAWKFKLDKKCTQIKLTLTSAGTPSTASKIEIKGNDVSCGEAQTLSTKGGTVTYNIPAALQNAGTEYSFVVTNKNTQLSKIVYMVEDGGGQLLTPKLLRHPQSSLMAVRSRPVILSRSIVLLRASHIIMPGMAVQKLSVRQHQHRPELSVYMPQKMA